MSRSNKGHKFIVCVIDEVMNYLKTILIHQSKSEEIGDAIIEHVTTKYCVPEYIIMDQDKKFMSLLMNYLSKKLDIRIKTVASYSHQSLQAEHGSKPLLTILMKLLTNLGQMWPKYLPLAMFAYNTFHTPNLANYSPYELVFSRKPKLLLNIETMADIKVFGTFKDCYKLIK